ncbi:MAG: tetratricopeptide repeat protein [Betaproteobacteria bacterium]|nr:tetratricopeptide repeat protein [Betaproteobacteria bacterium]
MRHGARRLLTLLLAVILTAGAAGVEAQSSVADVLARAAALSQAGQHAQAYALLAAEEDTHIGEIAFDYALGRAALNAGRPDRATLAFARVLALDPGHAGARIDMGRAYLALGNRAQARAVFEALLDLDPPPALRAQLLVYLGEAREARRAGSAARGYLSVFGGTSSNVNQAPGQSQVFVPGLVAVLQLADQNVRMHDTFTGVSGGIEAAMPLDRRVSLIGGAEFLGRFNTHESAFDVGGIAANAGLGWVGQRHVVRGQLQLVRSTLGGSTSREVRALSLDFAETSAAPGTLGTLFGFLHAGGYRHPPADLRIFDADFVLVGAGANMPIDQYSTASVALSAGGDNDRGGNPSGDRSGLGLRLAWERLLGPKLRLAALVGVQESRYHGFDPAFLAQRDDRRTDLESFLRYELTPKLELRIGVLRSVQESNIPIYEFRRTDWTLTLRRQFD